MKKKKVKSFSTKEVAFLVIATCIISFGMAMAIRGHKQTKVKYVEDENLAMLLEQYNFLTNNYVEKADKEKIINGAIMGMLYSLDDPYAEYYDETSSETFNARINGSYEGIGIEFVRLNTGEAYILSVFKNSSADIAGIKKNDIITKVDDKALSEMDNDEFLNYIKGKNSELKLTVLREAEELEFKVQKSHVVIESVEFKYIDGYGYIKINTFALNTYSQFKYAFDRLNEKQIKGLIIDLRDNGGGHLSVSEDILSLFLDDDKVLYHMMNQTDRVIVKSKGNIDYKRPIAILINGNSASASELIASALSEQLGATLVGEKTYGKGTVQKLINLPNGTQYKVTTDKWLTSKGVYNEGKGIAPDIEFVGTSDEEYIKKAIEAIEKKNG